MSVSLQAALAISEDCQLLQAEVQALSQFLSAERKLHWVELILPPALLIR